MCLLLTFSCATLMLLQQVGPTAQAAAQHPEHVAGTIVSVTSDRSFTLRTVSGTLLQFSCGAACQASLWHMQRHVQERAHTDVFYKKQNQQLQALYVD
jgi:hypothetical protein